jgi:hypothetical protein
MKMDLLYVVNFVVAHEEETCKKPTVIFLTKKQEGELVEDVIRRINISKEKDLTLEKILGIPITIMSEKEEILDLRKM